MVVMAVAGAGREITDVRRGVIDRARLARTDDICVYVSEWLLEKRDGLTGKRRTKKTDHTKKVQKLKVQGTGSARNTM